MRILLTLDRDADAEANDYVRSLVAAGVPRESIEVASPETAPPGEFDGLVLGGGIDVDPARYGRPILQNASVEVDAERDALDFRALEQAQRRRVPVLGICRGLQVVNVAAGGTLVQDIPTERPSEVVHQRAFRSARLAAATDEKTRRDHQVSVRPGTRLAEVAQAREIDVNSRHHQAIERLGARLAVSATAPDGVAEAVEAVDGGWMLAVQWHPENLAGDRVSQRIFSAFLDAVRERARAASEESEASEYRDPKRVVESGPSGKNKGAPA